MESYKVSKKNLREVYMKMSSFPEYILQRIDKQFLASFRDEIEKEFIDRLPDNPTYWNFYEKYDNSNGFYSALKIACESHDFNELYDYLMDLGCYFNECLGGKLTEMMYEQGVVEEGTWENPYQDLYDFELPDVYEEEAI